MICVFNFVVLSFRFSFFVTSVFVLTLVRLCPHVWSLQVLVEGQTGLNPNKQEKKKVKEADTKRGKTNLVGTLDGLNRVDGLVALFALGVHPLSFCLAFGFFV